MESLESPTPEAIRRIKEFKDQAKYFLSIKELLQQQYTNNPWFVVCQKRLIGGFESSEEARNAGRETAKKENTEIFLVCRLNRE